MKDLIFYLICIGMSVFFFLLYENESIKKIKIKNIISLDKIFLLISALIPILISGLRYNVGIDYKTYVGRFREIGATSFANCLSKSLELGDFILCKICYIISHEPQIFLLSYATLTIFFIYKSIINNKTHKIISLLLFLCIYWPFSMNGMRQALAMAIVLFSYKYVLDKKIFKFLAFSLLAASFHITALIAIPLGIIWILLDKFKYKIHVIFSVYLLIPVLILVIFPLLGFISPFQKYLVYFSQLSNFSGIGVGILIQNLPLLAILILYGKLLIKDNKNNKLYIIMIIIGIILEHLGYISLYLGRLAMYFSLAKILLFPEFVNLVENKKYKRYIISILTIYALGYSFIYLCYIKNWFGIFPYTISLFKK